MKLDLLAGHVFQIWLAVLFTWECPLARHCRIQTLFYGLVQCIPDLSYMCSHIDQVDCLFEYVSDKYETVCASNNQTYQNFCFYSKVRCRFPEVHVIGVGTCDDVFRSTVAPTQKPTTPTPTTTMRTSPVSLTSKKPPTTASTTTASTTTMSTTPMSTVTSTTTMATTTVDHVKEAFCASKDTVACPTTLDPICASDKTFYLNKCEFSKASCDDDSLVIKDISFCTGITK